ncbi:MAG: patatin-like phospholipase family protein [Acidobacteriota bacterium]
MAAHRGFLETSRITRPFALGVALGGGAARGLAHIGVLKVLCREGLAPQVIAGTSAGALVGAAFATCGDMVSVEDRFVAYCSGDRFKKSSFGMFRQGDPARKTFFQQVTQAVKKGLILGVSATKPSFISAKSFDEDLRELLPDPPIEDLPLPFCAIATDIVAGKEVVMRTGSLRVAVAASCALPGVLPPVAWRGTTLIDGGSVNKVPAGPARSMGADLVVAVDIHASLPESPVLTRGLDIVSRSNAITGHKLRELLLAEADVVIRPEVGHIHWADFGRYAEAIRSGEEAASRAPPRAARAGPGRAPQAIPGTLATAPDRSWTRARAEPALADRRRGARRSKS